jgi:hypothetical protein
LRRVAPASVFIQIAGSNHAGRNILRRSGFVFALVAYFAPVIEAIPPRRVHGLVRQRSSAGKARLLACPHLNRWSLPSGLAFTLPYSNDSCVCIGIDVEAVIATLVYGERYVLGVDLINFAVVQFAHMQVQRALMQLHLYRIVGDIGQSQTALRIDAH